MVAQLLASADQERARVFIEAQGLTFEEEFDDIVGIFEGSRLIATGARAGNVLKMLAIEPSQQGGGLLGELVTDLVGRVHAAGHDQSFIFTRPEFVTSFQPLNFVLLASHDRAALLEHGNGFRHYLEENRHLVSEGENGAVVVNCNPFTLGHRYLVEQAAKRVATLYVFVVREDRSAFPFEVRIRLVREGTQDLANVRVLDTSHYAVSAITFPAYFLKDPGSRADVQMDLDLVLFARRIAPFFHVKRRFFGTEPYCQGTRAYNEAMHRVLPPLGVEVEEIPRAEVGGEAISASRVRAALREGELTALSGLIPDSTLAFLLSDEARAVRAKLCAEEGRHS